MFLLHSEFSETLGSGLGLIGFVRRPSKKMVVDPNSCSQNRVLGFRVGRHAICLFF